MKYFSSEGNVIYREDDNGDVYFYDTIFQPAGWRKSVIQVICPADDIIPISKEEAFIEIL